MRRSGKITLGLLTVTALVGTAYAAWTINDKFNKVDIIDDATAVDTINHEDIGKIVVTPTGKPIKFDGAKNGQSQLTRSFNIAVDTEAIPAGKELKDIYNPVLYEGNAPDFIPNIYVSVQVLDKATHEVLDENAEFYNYVEKPVEVKTVSYTDWLDPACGTVTPGQKKTDGYDGFSYTFAYKDGINPEDRLTYTEGRETQMKHIASVLNGVAFKYTFQVGQYGSYAKEETGKVTLPETKAGSAFNIPAMENGKIPSGEQTIELTLTDATKDLKDKTIIVKERKDSSSEYTTTAVKAVESGAKGALNLQNTDVVYTFTYVFKTGYEYAFDYELIEFATAIKDTQLAEGLDINISKAGTYVGDTIEFTIVYKDSDFRLVDHSVKVGEDEATLKEGKTYTYKLVNPGENVVTFKAEKILPTTIKYEKPAHGEIHYETSQGGKVVSLTNTPDSGYTLDHYEVDGTTYPASEKPVEVTLTPEKENVITGSFKELERSITYGVAENGSITGSTTALVGEKVTVTVNANEHYELNTLTHNGNDIKGSTEFTVVEGKNEILATFIGKAATITVTQVEGGTITAENLDGHRFGETYTFTVDADETHELVKVTNNGTTVEPTAGNSYEITLAEANEITAEYKLKAVEPPHVANPRTVYIRALNQDILNDYGYLPYIKLSNDDGTITNATESNKFGEVGRHLSYNGEFHQNTYQVDLADVKEVYTKATFRIAKDNGKDGYEVTVDIWDMRYGPNFCFDSISTGHYEYDTLEFEQTFGKESLDIAESTTYTLKVRNAGGARYNDLIWIRFQGSNESKALTLTNFKVDGKPVQAEEVYAEERFLGYNIDWKFDPTITITITAEIHATEANTYKFKALGNGNNNTSSTQNIVFTTTEVPAPTFVVTSEHGKVELDKTENYVAGDAILITVTPDENYTIKDAYFNSVLKEQDDVNSYLVELVEGENTLVINYDYHEPVKPATLVITKNNSNVEIAEGPYTLNQELQATITATDGNKISKVEFNGTTITGTEQGVYTLVLAKTENTLVVTTEEVKTEPVSIGCVTFDASKSLENSKFSKIGDTLYNAETLNISNIDATNCYGTKKSNADKNAPHAIKFGKSSGGDITITLAANTNISKVALNIENYGKDVAKINAILGSTPAKATVNATADPSVIELVFEKAVNTNTITIETSKAAYLYSIELFN